MYIVVVSVHISVVFRGLFLIGETEVEEPTCLAAMLHVRVFGLTRNTVHNWENSAVSAVSVD